MEIEKILTLIDKVSASGLTEFTLEEGNLQLCMKKRKSRKDLHGRYRSRAGRGFYGSREKQRHVP